MKRLIFTLIFLFCLSPIVQADDYWVYVRLEDRYGLDQETTAGRSKRGDVVDVVPVIEGRIPTKKEQQDYAIFRVTGLTLEDVDLAKTVWSGAEDIIDEKGQSQVKAYRQYKVDSNVLKGLKRGIFPRVIDRETAMSILIQKNDLDLLSYKMGTWKYALARPLRIAWDFYVDRKAWASTVNTWSVYKTGGDYTTFTLCEDDRDGDLVAEARREVCEGYTDFGTVTEGNITLDGSTTDTTHYMVMTVAEGHRHNGTPGSGFVIDPVGYTTHGGGVFNIKDSYCVVEWFEITGWHGQYGGIYSGVSIPGNYDPTVRYNLIHDDDEDYITAYIYGVRMARNAKIVRNIIYNIGDQCVYNADQYGNMPIVNNNTCYNFDLDGSGVAGIHNRGGANGEVKNNLCVQGSATGPCFSYDADMDNNYNACSDTSCDSPTDIQNITSAVFVSTILGSEDLHLAATATSLIDAGEDLGTAYGVHIDIDQRDCDVEGDVYDIGADEYVASSGGSSIQQNRSILNAIMRGVM